MDLSFAADSRTAWDQLYMAIAKARFSVYMEMYMFSGDTEATHDFVGLLERKAREGVRVLMVLDAFGSWELPIETVKRMSDAGIDVRFFRHWIHRTHRKLTIVDRRIAFLGGVNIGLAVAGWRDLQLGFSGPLVARLVNSFERAYRLAGGQPLPEMSKSRKKLGRARLWIVEHSPVAGRRRLKKYYQRKIDRAKKTVVLVTPYFAPGKWFERLLARTVERGVRVELHLPQVSDIWLADQLNRHFAARAVGYGVQVRLSPSMNHAKAMLIDDMQGMVGSGNLDPLSFKLNNEIGVFFTDRHALDQLRRTVARWSEQSIAFKAAAYEVSWWAVFLAPFFRLLHPVM